MTRCLGQTHIPRDYSLKDLISKETPQIGGNLL